MKSFRREGTTGEGEREGEKKESGNRSDFQLA